MGQKGKGKKTTAYVHNHNPNPVARESDERKVERLHSMEHKRLKNSVERQVTLCYSYVHENDKKKKKIDPLYNLKGAARPARDFYKDPNYVEDVEPKNLMQLYEHKMWEHEEGQQLLVKMMELGVFLHNVIQKPKDAVEIFKDMLSHDHEDHLCARHCLVRCYMDMAEAGQARAILDKYEQSEKVPSSVPVSEYQHPPSACFAYCRALIEHIAVMLEEDDASEETKDALLGKAYELNPFAFWALAHHQIFSDVIEYTDQIDPTEFVGDGSVEEAFCFFQADLPLWLDTDGAIDWLQDYLIKHELGAPMVSYEGDEEGDAEDGEPPALVEVQDDGRPAKKVRTDDDDVDSQSGESEQDAKDEEEVNMYVTMFETAIGMISES